MPNQGTRDKGKQRKLSARERASLRYRSDLLVALRSLHANVGTAPKGVSIHRSSIQGFVAAAVSLFGIDPNKFAEMDYITVKWVRGELHRALVPLGLDVEDAEKLKGWRSEDAQ